MLINLVGLLVSLRMAHDAIILASKYSGGWVG